MSVETLANYAEIIGISLVVVSLLFVAAQLRQNAKSSQSAARLGWASIQAEWHRYLAQDPDIARIVQTGASGGIESLTPEEQQRYEWWFIGYLHSWDAYFHEYFAGQIPEEFYETFERLLGGFFQIEANQRWWRAEEEVGRYTDKFTAKVNELIANPPKDRWAFKSAGDVFRSG
jgi:hypothetical protein